LVAFARTRNRRSKNWNADGLWCWLVVMETQKLVNTVMENVIRNFEVKLTDVEKIDLETVELRHRNTSNSSPTSI